MAMVNIGGSEVTFEAAVNLMDIGILAGIHDNDMNFEPETQEQDFVDLYARLHKACFGTDFVVN